MRKQLFGTKSFIFPHIVYGYLLCVFSFQLYYLEPSPEQCVHTNAPTYNLLWSQYALPNSLYSMAYCNQMFLSQLPVPE